MDIDVSVWIIEFIIRQSSVDDRLLNDLLRVLPLPNNNPSLKKSLILRKIKSDVEKGTISERTLEYLEQIEELDIREGNAEVSEAMKAAYCTVAVRCTANLIEESAGDEKWKCCSAVRRIWSGRIREIEKSDVAKRVGLVSDDLLSWMNDIETGVWDVTVCENVLAKFKGLDVSEVVLRYVNEAREKMGPSFLELVSVTALSDDELRKIMGLDKDGECNDPNKDCAPTVVPDARQDVDVDANCTNKDNEACNANIQPRHKHITTRCPRGAKIVDSMETEHNKYDNICTPDVNKVQEALETSNFELHAVVRDPLPDALRFAESFNASLSGENTACDPAVGNINRVNGEVPSSSHDRKRKALEANRDDQNKRPKFSLMERNSTAHTVEWSDSIDSSEKGSPTRPHLPSPKRRAVSPLSIYKIKKLRRPKKRWTTIEEDTLRTGVQKYGTGNWKVILSMYRDIFEDRNEVDLKDKWRNLTRY